MRKVIFLGDSLKVIKNFPEAVRREAGYQIDNVQNGIAPNDWKPMTTIGVGVKEIRINEDNNKFRVIYVAKINDFVHVLHAFNKKTQKTSIKDLALAIKRFKEIK